MKYLCSKKKEKIFEVISLNNFREKNSFFYLISWKINIEEKKMCELTLN